MIFEMLTAERLRSLLLQIPGATHVLAEREDGKFIALVVSPEFAGVPEHERQTAVWGLLLENLSDAEQAEVGYVFTNTPEEKAAAEARAASGA
jgi:acid stress-induced BolA-like protein IbaG/YrbA